MENIISKQQEIDIKNIIKNLKINEEFEVRFTNFQNVSKYNIPYINFETFIIIKKYLEKFATLRHLRNEFVEYYPKKTRKITVYKEFDKNSDILSIRNMEKEKKCNINIPQLGLKFSHSLENDIPNSIENKAILTKFRKRYSYYYKGIIIEISKFKENEEENFLFDVELEICPYNIMDSDIIYNEFIHIINQVVKIIQKTENILTFKEYTEVKNAYTKLTNKSFTFIGVQPLPIRQSRISTDTDYALTFKLDGKRSLLFIFNQDVYLINSKMEINKTDIKVSSEFDDSIIDTELYLDKIYCLDILYNSKENIQEKNLIDRLNILKKILTTVNNDRILYKSYSIDDENLKDLDFYEVSNKYLDKLTEYSNGNFTIDGIIFVPINKPYSKIYPPLKWKNEKDTTIDFKIKKIDRNDKEEIWNLYCLSERNDNCLFGYKDYFKNIHLTKVSTNIAQNFCDDTVIEFKFNKKNESFEPIRTRFDKINGNYIEIAKDNFDLILKPFDFEEKIEVNIDNIKRFSNYIKRVLISKTTKNTSNIELLSIDNDLSDISKYIDFNIRKTSFYCHCEKYLDKMKIFYEKLVSNPINKNFIYNFEILKNSKYDLIICFDANGIFETENNLYNFIKLIENNLEEKGTLIVFIEHSNKINSSLFSVPENKKNFTKKSIGEKIKIKYQGKETERTLKSVKFLEKILKKKNVILKKTETFKEYYKDWKINDNFLTDIEKEYIFDNTILYFNKNV